MAFVVPLSIVYPVCSAWPQLEGDDPKDTPLFYFSPIHTVRLYLARQPRDVYVYLGKTLAQLQGSIDVKAVEDLKSDAGMHLSRTLDAVVADVGADDLLAVRCKYSGRRARQLAPSGTERDATRVSGTRVETTAREASGAPLAMTMQQPWGHDGPVSSPPPYAFEP